MMKMRFFLLVPLFQFPALAFAQNAQEQAVEERLYNFDDMLIDGAFRDPQGMFERARAESNIEGVLQIERHFTNKSCDDVQDSSMRP